MKASIQNLTDDKLPLAGKILLPRAWVNGAEFFDSEREMFFDSDLRSLLAAGKAMAHNLGQPEDLAPPPAPASGEPPPAPASGEDVPPPAPPPVWLTWSTEQLYALAQTAGMKGRSKIREDREALLAGLSAMEITGEMVAQATTEAA